MIHFTVTCVNTMSRYFYLVFLLISIHNSFCNIEDHNEYRELIRSSRQTAYKPRRHIRRSNKAHHQGFRRIRADKDAGEINDLLQEIDVASFMQSPDYERQRLLQNNNKGRFRESKYAPNRMNEDMMIDNPNRLDNELQSVALNKFDKYEQMSYNVNNNNQYGRQYEDATTKSTKGTSQHNKWVYKGITFPFFSHNKALRTSHKKVKRKYDMYDDRDRVNDDHVQLLSSRYISKPLSYKIMKRSNAGRCNCKLCRSMRSIRKRQAYNSINARPPRAIYHKSKINSIKVNNDEPNSDIFSGHGRHGRQLNMANELKDFESDITTLETSGKQKDEFAKSINEFAQQQLRELSEVEHKIDRVTIKNVV